MVASQWTHVFIEIEYLPGNFFRSRYFLNFFIKFFQKTAPGPEIRGKLCSLYREMAEVTPAHICFRGKHGFIFALIGLSSDLFSSFLRVKFLRKILFQGGSKRGETGAR